MIPELFPLDHFFFWYLSRLVAFSNSILVYLLKILPQTDCFVVVVIVVVPVIVAVAAVFLNALYLAVTRQLHSVSNSDRSFRLTCKYKQAAGAEVLEKR